MRNKGKKKEWRIERFSNKSVKIKDKQTKGKIKKDKKYDINNIRKERKERKKNGIEN